MIYELSEERFGDLGQAARRGRAIASAARNAVEEADGFLVCPAAKMWLHDAEELISELWDKFDFVDQQLATLDREWVAAKAAVRSISE